jgi:hypothetical protein
MKHPVEKIFRSCPEVATTIETNALILLGQIMSIFLNSCFDRTVCIKCKIFHECFCSLSTCSFLSAVFNSRKIKIESHFHTSFKRVFPFKLSCLRFLWLINLVHCVPQISTFAGYGSVGTSGDGGAATSATFRTTSALWGDSTGTIYISDYSSFKIRAVNSLNIINTYAGTGTQGQTGFNSAATSGNIGSTTSLNGFGTALYFVDGYNLIRAVSLSNNVVKENFAGTGETGTSGDTGQATAAKFNGVSHVGTDSVGNVYIGEEGGSVIRKVLLSNTVITTIAGIAGVPGLSVTNARATSTSINIPRQIFCDTVATLYFADNGSGFVRKIGLNNNIITKAFSTALSDVVGVWGQSNGIIYTTESSNSRVNMINSGIISLLVGTSSGNAGFLGDGGSPTSAQVSTPTTLFIDTNNIMYIADSENNRVRKIYDAVTLAPSVIPTTPPTVSPTTMPTTLGAVAIYFPFTGNAVDVSGNGYSASVNGATLAVDRFGIAGGAVLFSASPQSIRVSNGPLLQIGTGDFTFAAWIRTSVSGTAQRIFSHGDLSASVPGYAIYVLGDASSAFYFQMTCVDNGGSSGVQGTTAVNTNTWQFVTVTVQRGVAAKVYVNGALEGQVVPRVCDITNTAVGFYIGAYDSTGTDQFFGKIDEVRIFNRALSQSDVFAIYNDQQPTSMQCDELIVSKC